MRSNPTQDDGPSRKKISSKKLFWLRRWNLKKRKRGRRKKYFVISYNSIFCVRNSLQSATARAKSLFQQKKIDVYFDAKDEKEKRF
jgi:hypothetical protein